MIHLLPLEPYILVVLAKLKIVNPVFFLHFCTRIILEIMNILLLGSGGREHAMAHSIQKSKKLGKLFITPGNPGTASCGINVRPELKSTAEIKTFCLENDIDCIVVGPEVPLINGIYDQIKTDIQTTHIAVIGPSQQGAMLEGSKDFAKEFMQKYNIPTAAYKTFTKENLYEGFKFIDSLKAPYVLKADGPAAGKGVLIIDDADDAKRELAAMVSENKFGDSGNKVVIEQFLKGIECSYFVATDGKNYILLPNAKDYKRIGEGDTGLNTGGMGAISPVPFATEELTQKVIKQVVEPTVRGLENENIIYKGFIYVGLMIVGGEPFVIEYNCRMGDPETEVVFPRIESDIIELFDAIENENLDNLKLKIDKRAACTVVVSSGGYPEHYPTGFSINGLGDSKDSIIFHAGTKKDGNRILTSGGRVLAVTSFGKNLKEALSKSYASINQIEFDGKYFRSDIGFDVDTEA